MERYINLQTQSSIPDIRRGVHIVPLTIWRFLISQNYGNNIQTYEYYFFYNYNKFILQVQAFTVIYILFLIVYNSNIKCCFRALSWFALYISDRALGADLTYALRGVSSRNTRVSEHSGHIPVSPWRVLSNVCRLHNYPMINNTYYHSIVWTTLLLSISFDL